eukprot:9796679-Lingulodinium_polyedra.AAC.1
MRKYNKTQNRPARALPGTVKQVFQNVAGVHTSVAYSTFARYISIKSGRAGYCKPKKETDKCA